MRFAHVLAEFLPAQLERQRRQLDLPLIISSPIDPSLVFACSPEAAQAGVGAGPAAQGPSGRPTPPPGAQVWNIIRDRRILYAASRVDITNEVLLQMNNEYKAGKR